MFAFVMLGASVTTPSSHTALIAAKGWLFEAPGKAIEAAVE